nr:hypothetical protein GCM10010200_100710 [Actinomadura rugatobispora]
MEYLTAVPWVTGPNLGRSVTHQDGTAGLAATSPLPTGPAYGLVRAEARKAGPGHLRARLTANFVNTLLLWRSRVRG